MEPRTAQPKSRFEIEKLEERIAPRNQPNGSHNLNDDVNHPGDGPQQEQPDGQN